MTTTTTKGINMNTNTVMSLSDRIDAFVLSQCYNEQLDTRAVFGYDADYITFYVGDIDEDEIAIPFIHYVNIDDFAVKATLVGYRNGKATYNLLVK
jgi:hypothetical protein